ncbi:hypothetical protein HPP92_026785 [Vanilla planifolia]|uniref:Poly(A) RNA polymerase mitochondrial-like central palm domain-containing protein n=1 Tax=Vanilla planifolia TaxID=51239 RepID=A0A835PE75_VANPL|nr:hypothetical protein HPP92_026785 [Vanilla planifolia]
MLINQVIDKMSLHQLPHLHSSSHAELEICAKEILNCLNPTADDMVRRQKTINELVNVLRSDQSLKGLLVISFGSFIANLYTRWGDLDISINLNQSKRCDASRKQKLNVLKNVMRALQQTGVAYGIEYVSNAKVPIVNIDEHFREFVLLIKEWAKAQHVNESKTGTLNSYSLCLLIIFHFQTCTPAIFPPLMNLFKPNDVDFVNGDMTHIVDSFAANIAMYKSQTSRKGKQSRLSELLISFFEKFSTLDDLASKLAICTYTGRWEQISSNYSWMQKRHSLFIEDPFEQPENAARSVSNPGLIEISQAIRNTYRMLSSSSVSSDRFSLLRTLVRPEIRSKLGNKHDPVHYRFEKSLNPHHHVANLNQSQPYSVRLVEQHQNPYGSTFYRRRVDVETQASEYWRYRNSPRLS